MALYHLLTAQGKRVRPVVPEQVPETCLHLPESSQIKSDLGPKNLIISFDTNETPIDKVDYSTENGTFSLVIYPTDRHFKVEKINYSYQGTSFDLLITLGVSRLADLGTFYTNHHEDFHRVPVVSLHHQDPQEDFSRLSLVDTSFSSLSELILYKLAQWGWKPTRLATECLLTGLQASPPFPYSNESTLDHERPLPEPDPAPVLDTNPPPAPPAPPSPPLSPSPYPDLSA